MSDPICANCGKSVLECQGFCERKIIDKVSILPSLSGWVEVEECPFYIRFADQNMHVPDCNLCHGTGEIRTPLQFEDVDWGEILEYLNYIDICFTSIFAGKFTLQEIMENRLRLDRLLKTKSGARIEREK